MSDADADVPTDQIVETCRTAIGDELRSVVYFTPDDHEQLYVRENLEPEADTGSFAENERAGFSWRENDSNSELGDYEFTVHGFENGYLVRVIAGDEGVFVTTDELTMRRFRDAAVAIEGLFDAVTDDGGADAR